MSWTEQTTSDRRDLPEHKPRSAKLRDFGMVMALAFVLLGGIQLLRGSGALAPALVVVGALFGLCGFLAPNLLDVPERLWMALGEKLSLVATFIVVPLTFFCVVLPIGLLIRLLGKDPLARRLKRETEGESYWMPIEKDGPASRPHAPY